MNKIGIVIATRANSQRFPNKILVQVQGKSLLEHLINRLKQSVFKIVIATTNNLLNEPIIDIAKIKEVELFIAKEEEDVLRRLIDVCNKFNFQHIIRITHDDLFIDIKLMEAMAEFHLRKKSDYTYFSYAIKGTDCEIISKNALIKAEANTRHLKRREHITNYIKDKPGLRTIRFPLEYRLSFDYEEDLRMINYLTDKLNIELSKINLQDIRDVFLRDPDLIKINKLPKVSVYITNYNYCDFVGRAIESVINQTFRNWELIIIDDFSDDNSLNIINKYLSDKVKLIQNNQNLGLTKSSNKAILQTRGEYIIRLDADDWLEKNALEEMFFNLKGRMEYGALISDYFVGSKVFPHLSLEYYHPACALIRKSYWNDIRYNEEISCQNGVDFWIQYVKTYKIYHLNQPLWHYNNHSRSLSSNKEKIMETRKKILDANNR